MSKTLQKQNTKQSAIDMNTEFDLGASVSEQVAIQDLFLIGSSCNQTPEAMLNELEFNFNQSAVTYSQGDNVIIVLTTFGIKGSPKTRKDESMLNIEAHYLIAYSMENVKEVSQNNLDAFGRTNGVYNAWPYWREFVQSTVQRMGLPKVVLPVFRLGSTKKPAEKKISSRKAKASKKK